MCLIWWRAAVYIRCQPPLLFLSSGPQSVQADGRQLPESPGWVRYRSHVQSGRAPGRCICRHYCRHFCCSGGFYCSSIERGGGEEEEEGPLCWISLVSISPQVISIKWCARLYNYPWADELQGTCMRQRWGCLFLKVYRTSELRRQTMSEKWTHYEGENKRMLKLCKILCSLCQWTQGKHFSFFCMKIKAVCQVRGSSDWMFLITNSVVHCVNEEPCLGQELSTETPLLTNTNIRAALLLLFFTVAWCKH